MIYPTTTLLTPPTAPLIPPPTVHSPMYKLNIQILDKSLEQYYCNHGPAYYDDAGIDLYIPYSIFVPAKAIGFKINLGIRCELIDTQTGKNSSYFIFPRSSLSLTPLRLSYSVGIIDAGFRGGPDFICDNLSDIDYYIERGTRTIQICAPELKPIVINIVKELSIGSRGDKGLGSSGRGSGRNFITSRL